MQQLHSQTDHQSKNVCPLDATPAAHVSGEKLLPIQARKIRTTMFGRLPQTSFVAFVRQQPFCMLQRALSPTFAIPAVMHGTLRWMPIIKGSHLWTITLLVGKACRLVLFSSTTVSCRCRSFLGIASWRSGRSQTLPFSFGFLSLFLGRVSFHIHLLENTDLRLSIARNLHCFFFLCPWTFPWLQQGQRVNFSSCLLQEEKRFSRVWCSRYRTTIFLSLV